jgi:hypothetical protein
MAGVRVEGVDALTESFDRIVGEIPKTLQGVVKRGAQNIKTDWRRRWSGIKHAPRLPYSITYDTHVSGSRVWAEIGPVDGPEKQGFLGRIIEYGGIHSGPIPGGIPAADAEAPRFERAVADAVAELVSKV